MDLIEHCSSQTQPLDLFTFAVLKQRHRTTKQEGICSAQSNKIIRMLKALHGAASVSKNVADESRDYGVGPAAPYGFRQAFRLAPCHIDQRTNPTGSGLTLRKRHNSSDWRSDRRLDPRLHGAKAMAKLKRIGENQPHSPRGRRKASVGHSPISGSIASSRSKILIISADFLGHSACVG
jgi:hypothetical protein